MLLQNKKCTKTQKHRQINKSYKKMKGSTKLLEIRIYSKLNFDDHVLNLSSKGQCTKCKESFKNVKE